jgi:hypothetical protein
MKKSMVLIIFFSITFICSKVTAQQQVILNPFIGEWIEIQSLNKGKKFKLNMTDTNLLLIRTYPGRIDTLQDLENPNKLHLVKGYPKIDTIYFKYIIINNSKKLEFNLYPELDKIGLKKMSDTAIYLKADFEMLNANKTGKNRAKVFFYFDNTLDNNNFLILEKLSSKKNIFLTK